MGKGTWTVVMNSVSGALAGLAGALLVFVTAPIVDIVAPRTGIVIHSLTITNDPVVSIVQDRTVTATNALIAEWKTEITANGRRVDACSGSGFWPYSSGRKQPKFTFDEWTDRPGCWNALPTGQSLQACAIYTWGDGEISRQCTLTFRKNL